MLQQRLWTWMLVMLNLSMACSTQGYEIAQLVCRLPISVKAHVRNNVMHVNPPFLASILVGFTANLALVTISLKRQRALFSPVAPAIMFLPALPAGMSCAAHSLRHESVLTGSTAKAAMSLLCENLVSRVWLAALGAVLCYKVFRSTSRQFWLSCAKFRTALRRTKAPRTAVPSNEGFVAVFAGAFFLRLDAASPFVLIAALRRAVFLRHNTLCELFTTLRAIARIALALSEFKALARTIFSSFEVRRFEIVTEVFTADRAGFHDVFLSPYSVLSLATGGIVRLSVIGLANALIISQRAVSCH